MILLAVVSINSIQASPTVGKLADVMVCEIACVIEYTISKSVIVFFIFLSFKLILLVLIDVGDLYSDIVFVEESIAKHLRLRGSADRRPTNFVSIGACQT